MCNRFISLGPFLVPPTIGFGHITVGNSMDKKQGGLSCKCPARLRRGRHHVK